MQYSGGLEIAPVLNYPGNRFEIRCGDTHRMIPADGYTIFLAAAAIGLLAGRSGSSFVLCAVATLFGVELLSLGIAQSIGFLDAGTAILAFNLGAAAALSAPAKLLPIRR